MQGQVAQTAARIKDENGHSIHVLLYVETEL